MTLLRALEVAFWSGPVLAAGVYAGYPLLLALLVVLRRRRLPGGAIIFRPWCSWGCMTHAARPDVELPAASVIVAAHNEARHIAARLDNLLQARYPAGKLEIIVVDDGSTDVTADIVRGYADHGVRLLRQTPQQGKTAAQNLAVAAATGEVLVFTDANGEFGPDTVRCLVEWFADPAVGGVCGELHYLPADGRAAGFGERLYWRYECLLKRLENISGSLVGMNGAVYAMPRRLYEPLPADAQSDLVVALRLRARGKLVVYDDNAICAEPVYDQAAVSFTVKRRIVARAMAAILAEAYRFKRIGQPWFALKLLVHKVLRWLLPWLLLLSVPLAFLLGCGEVAAAAWYRVLFALQLLFVALALAGAVADRMGVNLRPLALPYYFCLVNLAAMAGLLDFLRGRASSIWRPQR